VRGVNVVVLRTGYVFTRSQAQIVLNRLRRICQAHFVQSLLSIRRINDPAACRRGRSQWL